jgi:hypothetical protein
MQYPFLLRLAAARTYAAILLLSAITHSLHFNQVVGEASFQDCV